MPSACHLPLVLLFLAHWHLVTFAWFFPSDHKCFFHCGRAGDCGAGKSVTLHRFRRCENFLYTNRKVGIGPDVCSAPLWQGDRPFARKYFPYRVCRQEIRCIEHALQRRARSETDRSMLDVLRVRKRNNALRDEIRFSRDESYVKSVDKLTSDSTRAELFRFIAKGGKIDVQSQFGNPLYRRVAHYLMENTRMRWLLREDRVRKARMRKDEMKTKFLRRMKGHFEKVQNTKSKLRTKRRTDIKNVRAWLKEIKRIARWMRYIQDEAVQILFYQTEYREVKREVAEEEREVQVLKEKIRAKVEEKNYHRNALAMEKKKLVDTVRSLSKKVIAWQEKNCK